MRKRTRKPKPTPQSPQVVIDSKQPTGFTSGPATFQGTGSFAGSHFRDKAVDRRA